MNIIIPMAGMGKRLRPHTLTTPKPLVPIAGKPIVQHLVEDIAGLVHEPINQIVFITGRFGDDAEKHLLEVATSLGATGRIAYQDEALGTAHAVWCAKEALVGKVIVAFADTLFRAKFALDDTMDGVLWVKKIEDPSAFGVVKLREDGTIIDFVEKPTAFVSDLAMIGIYYFKDGEKLASEIAYLIENKVTKGGEYQLPDALRRMTEKGNRFAPGEVDEWMDCGNPKATIETNERVLHYKHPKSEIHETALVENSVVMHPCYIGPGAKITNSVIGPYVSLGEGSSLSNGRLERSIVQAHTHLSGSYIKDSMIGNHIVFKKAPEALSIGDYTQIG